MPNWFPSYTQCSSPSGWYKVPAWALALLTGVGLVALIAAGVAGAWAPGVAAFLATVCLAGITFCTWWLNVRLICLGGDRSAVGAIYHLEPPESSFDAFDVGKYDTDYSFNLLLWQFTPKEELPSDFVTNQWSAAAAGQLQAEWTALPPLVPAVPFAKVSDEVNLMVAQQSMASRHLTFVGQDVEAADEPSPQPPNGSGQHFLIHCEIEGPGIRDLRTFLWVLFGVFVAAAALSAIPVIGSALAWILSILALLAFLIGGPILQNQQAGPPTGGGWGGTFHSYDSAGNAKDPVDLGYIFGRWVYDSFHDGWNELHPVHYMIKIGTTTQGDLNAGNWPEDLGDKQNRLDGAFAQINSPASAATQKEPQNQWVLHPMLDGCLGETPYPEPKPTPVIK